MAHNYKALLNRRQILSGAASIGGASILSGFAQAAIPGKAYRPREKYRALVCVLMAGGCDSFTLLMPKFGAANTAYNTARSNLAIAADDMLEIYDDRSSSRYGLHPSTAGIQQLFSERRLGFVANVGTLVEPVTKEAFESETVRLPQGLRSHADQIDQWQTSRPTNRSAKGWGGLALEERIYNRERLNIPVNISLSGSNVFQFGNSTTEFAITNRGSSGLSSLDPDGAGYNEIFRMATQNILSRTGNDIFKEHYANTILEAHNTHLFFSNALENSAPLQTEFPRNRFGRNMEMVAQIIAARVALETRQQIFFVNFGGWDDHDNLLSQQQTRLTVLSDTLLAFDRAMQETRISENVTTFTISDFGRTLTSNGNGSDHGWGGNMMIMGGDVNGGKIHGNYPDLTLGNPLDVGGGVFIPTTPTDAIYSQLGDWFGVPRQSKPELLPNLVNFPNSMLDRRLFLSG